MEPENGANTRTNINLHVAIHSMKTSDLLLMGALGLGAYYLIQKKADEVTAPLTDVAHTVNSAVKAVKDVRIKYVPQSGLYIPKHPSPGAPKVYAHYTPPLLGPLAPKSIAEMKSWWI